MDIGGNVKIQQLHKLNAKQIMDIEELVQECLLTDGLERALYLNNDLNFYENLDSFYLLYDNNKLVSVLTIVQPLEDEAEISAYTLPVERNKGYFTALLDYAEEELVGYDIIRILFVVEPGSKDGDYALKACQAKFVSSEYLLILDMIEGKLCGKVSKKIPLIELVELQPPILKEVAILNAVIFDTEIESSLSLLNIALESEQIVSYCANLSGDMIGICNVNYGANHASLFGLGIAPQYQGKGYGRILLNLLLTKIVDHKASYLTLQVGSENKKAFSLYRSSGFQIKTQYDYYEYIIECEE